MPSFSSASQETTQTLPIGTQLEEFIIERVLGSGGFGITYLARDKRLGRRVVIKENLPAQFCWRDTHALTVHPRQTQGEDADNYQYSLDSFEREASTLASLDHPGIVRVLRSFEAYGTAYFVMPFVEGTALDEQIRARRDSDQPFTEEELGGLLWRVLEALAYLHDRGIYHRDIKPGNILVTAAGDPVLIDFGAARQRLSERSLTVIESPGYTPFEQLQSRGKVGPWSDIYALGGTLFKAITGQTPAKATDRAFDDPEAPLAERPDLRARYSSRLLKSIDKAMSPKAADRFQDAGQWRDWVWEATSQAPPKVVHEEPVAKTRATPPPLPESALAKSRQSQKAEAVPPPLPQAHEGDRRQQGSPPPPRGKKSSAATITLVFAVVTAVSGSIAYLLMPSTTAIESQSHSDENNAVSVDAAPSPPKGWNARTAPQEEVDRYASAGVLDAQVEKLGRILGASGGNQNKSVHSAEEMARAFEQATAFAFKGHPRSMNLLGACYQFGKGVTKDATAAVKWYTKSAEAGEDHAMTNLGFVYLSGIGVPKDLSEAARWFRKGAEGGDPRGMAMLGQSYANGAGVPKDETEAAHWYRKAGDLGYTPAMVSLGYAFVNGLGVVKNESTAVMWYRKAAEAENSDGMNNLGVCFQNGTGVVKDVAEAVSWYRQAAEAGNIYGMNNLGVCFQNGIGVVKDETAAASWYRKAAEGGNERAMRNLSACYSSGTGVRKDEAQAAAWLRKATEAAAANRE